MDDLVVAVLVGTTREQRESIHAARLIANIGRQRENVHIEFVDPQNFVFPNDGNDPEGKDPRYTAITEAADAFYIVTPEYNHGYPGSLKRMLDSELANYFHKPVAFASCSAKFTGGNIAIQSLLGPVREMGLIATSYDVFFPKVSELFTDTGKLKAEHKDRYDKNIGQAYDELISYASMFKRLRQQTAEGLLQ